MTRLAVLVCALACVLSAAPAAGAEPEQAQTPRFEVHERSLRLSLRVEASNGYEGWIETEGHRRVTLTLKKGGTTFEARTTGRVTRHRIDARFGDMGDISVQFRGRPIDLTPRGDGDGDGERKCRGRKPAFESGLFRGTIRFREANGISGIDSKRATGFAIRTYRRVCKPDSRGSFSEVLKRLFRAMPVTALRARDRVGGINFRYQAAAIDLRPLFGAEFVILAHSAQAMERAQGMRLTRSVATEGGRRSFLFRRSGRAPRAATVTAPKPFTGSAKFVKERGSPASWTGSLAARLPGIGPVAMAGPGFKSATCNLTLGALLDGRCLPASEQVGMRALSLLHRALAQGSGSQSQFRWDDRLSWSR